MVIWFVKILFVVLETKLHFPRFLLLSILLFEVGVVWNRVIPRSGYTSITPVLQKLRWHPVEHCSLFKTEILVYKFLPSSFSKCFVRQTVCQTVWSYLCFLMLPSLCGKVGSSLPMVGSLQYRTLTNCLYWFHLPIKLPIII